MIRQIIPVILFLVIVSFTGCAKKDLQADEIYNLIAKNKQPVVGCMVDIKDEDSTFSSGVAFSVGDEHIKACTKNLDDFDVRILVFEKSDDAKIYYDVINNEKDYVQNILTKEYGFSERYIKENISYDTLLDHYSVGLNSHVVIILNNQFIGEIKDKFIVNMNKVFDSYTQTESENYSLSDYNKRYDELTKQHYIDSGLSAKFDKEKETTNEALESALAVQDTEITQENHLSVYASLMDGKKLAEKVMDSPAFREKGIELLDMVEGRISEFQKIHDCNVSTVEQLLGNVEKTFNYDTFSQASSLVDQYSASSLYTNEKSKWISRLSAVRTKVNEKKQFDDYVSDCVYVTYDDLMRYSEKYSNQKIVVSVYITDVEVDGIILDGTIWASMGGKTCTIKDNRTKKEPKILKGDTITIYGTGGGLGKVKRYIKGSGLLGSDLFAKTVEEYEVPVISATYVVFK